MVGSFRVCAIILAAGSGKRMEAGEKKQFLMLGGKPLFYYAYESFATHSAVDDILLVTAEEDIWKLKELLNDAVAESDRDRAGMLSKLRLVVPGGRERYDSVWNALKMIKSAMEKKALTEDVIVLIHDAARPFVSHSVIDRVLEKAQQGPTVPAVKVKDTIRVVEDGKVVDTPDRDTLYSIQTPQGFSFADLYHAYEKMTMDKAQEKGKNITDDAMVAEYYGKQKIEIVEGDYCNSKLTTPEDLEMAEQRIGRRNRL